jgi:hypothetical protein
MAGDWMKIELELPDKPEVHAIAGRLEIDSDAVVGKLIRVWQWFDKHTTNGNAHGVSFALADRITSVSGFGDAMAFVGWLEQQDKTLVMPKFERHTSASAKTRALTAKRVSKHAVKTNANPNANTNGVSVSLALPEKIREDIKEKVNQKKPSSLRSSPQKITFSQWQEQLRTSGDKAISDYRPVWEYAETVGLEADWIYIAWLKFKERYTEDTNNSGKRYIDWRRTFLNAVKDNWFKLWYLGDKGFTLTTTGSMADLETRA